MLTNPAGGEETVIPDPADYPDPLDGQAGAGRGRLLSAADRPRHQAPGQLRARGLATQVQPRRAADPAVARR